MKHSAETSRDGGREQKGGGEGPTGLRKYKRGTPGGVIWYQPRLLGFAHQLRTPRGGCPALCGACRTSFPDMDMPGHASSTSKATRAQESSPLRCRTRPGCAYPFDLPICVRLRLLHSHHRYVPRRLRGATVHVTNPLGERSWGVEEPWHSVGGEVVVVVSGNAECGCPRCPNSACLSTSLPRCQS